MNERRFKWVSSVTVSERSHELMARVQISSYHGDEVCVAVLLAKLLLQLLPRPSLVGTAELGQRNLDVIQIPRLVRLGETRPRLLNGHSRFGDYCCIHIDQEAQKRKSMLNHWLQICASCPFSSHNQQHVALPSYGSCRKEGLSRRSEGVAKKKGVDEKCRVK